MESLWLLNRNFVNVILWQGIADLADLILRFGIFYCFEFSVCSHFVIFSESMLVLLSL